MNVLALACIASLAAGCGSRCKDVESARTALTSRASAPDRGADLRVTMPFAQINSVTEDLLRAKPVTVPLALPDLGPGDISTREGLTATAAVVRLEPGPAEKIRFATQIAVRDGERDVTTITAEIDVAPVLELHPGGAELAIGFGPKDLVAIHPVLGADAKTKLGDAIAHRVPDWLHDRVPRGVLDEAAAKLASHLTGAAFDGLRTTLFARLGELTAWRVKLPELPIATHTMRSTSTALVIEVVTDLRVRRGLAGVTAESDVATVELSGSAAAELANWTIEHGYLPRHYDRGLTPRDDGEFTPRFDYIAGESHPIKIYVFQERGGCSYFRVGVRATIGIAGDLLTVVADDRDLEAKSANVVVEVTAAVKYFLFGWIDESKQVAAHTRLTLGGRPLDTAVTSAALDHDELRFGLAFTVPTGVGQRRK